MKMKNMNPQVLATMFLSFQRHLFTCPKEGDMFSVDKEDLSCDIYFTNSFWQNYLSELNDANVAGKFSSSNAATDWYDLLNDIRSASDCDLPEFANDYFLNLEPFI